MSRYELGEVGPLPSVVTANDVGLYLMTEKGMAVLEAALAANVEIAHVTTAPADGMNDDSHKRIALLAKEWGCPTFERASPPQFDGSNTIAAGWRWMLNRPNLIVLHDSLLPRYRGFSPLITALVNGEPEVGVTAFLAEAEPDTGPIIAQRSIPVAYPARMREVLDRLVPVYGELALELCKTIAEGLPIRYAAQDHSKATYSIWRDEDDYRIDWHADDRRLVRLVDAASDPFPGAWTTVYGVGRDWDVVRVLEAESWPDRRVEDRRPGKTAFLYDGDPVVVCATGLVRLRKITDPLGRPLRFTLKTRFR